MEEDFVKARLEKVFGSEATQVILKAYNEGKLEHVFEKSVARLIKLIIEGKTEYIDRCSVYERR